MTTTNGGFGPATQKPAVAQKSPLVLAVAREIIAQKRQHKGRSYSDSDIYDDILSLSELRNQTDDDIYDDIIPNVPLTQNESSDKMTHFGIVLVPDDGVYDDVISMRKELIGSTLIQQEPIPLVHDSSPAPPDQSHPTGLSQEVTESSRGETLRCNHDNISGESPKQAGDKHILPQTSTSRPNNSTSVSPSIHVSSFEDVYDDIVVYRNQSRSQKSKPNVPPKLKSLYQHPRVKELLLLQRQRKAQEIEEIYDTMTSEEQEFLRNNTVMDQNPGDEGELQEEYIDPATIQESSGSDEERYLNTTKEGRQIREKVKKIDYTKFGLKFVPTTKKSKTKDRPIDTSSPHEPNTPDKLSQLKSKSATLPSKSPIFLHSDTSSQNRQSNDPLPDINSRLNRFSFIGTDQPLECTTSDEEDYEDLALYEDVEQYQDRPQDEYEDLDSTVASALGLPERIRGRSTRIQGHKIRKLRKSVHKRVKQRTTPTSSASTSAVCTPGVTRKEKKDSNLESKSMPDLTPTDCHSEPKHYASVEKQPDSVNNNQERVDNQEGLDELKQAANTESKTESSDDESDDNHNEAAIPFGKSREVFELLLDASNIVRVAESSAIPSKSSINDSKLIACNESSSDSDSEQKYLDTIEFQRLSEVAQRDLKPYQEAGVIRIRPKSEIQADIEEIVKNAPLVPPPLPGIQRARTRVITHSDRVLRKRVIIRRHTMDAMPLDKQTS